MNLVTITNVSKQAVPILINSIASSNASDQSTIAPNIATQLSLAPGSGTTIEFIRVDQAQLEQLRNKRLLSFTIFNDNSESTSSALSQSINLHEFDPFSPSNTLDARDAPPTAIDEN